MFPASSLFTLCVAFTAAAHCSVASAIPTTPGAPPTLAFRTNINATGIGRIVDVDRSRAAAFKANGKIGKRASSISAMDSGVTYTASVGVGSPATSYSEHPVVSNALYHTNVFKALMIDTGSSDTWIGAGKKYVKTSTSVSTHRTIVSYCY
jgi:hypothetical protein